MHRIALRIGLAALLLTAAVTTGCAVRASAAGGGRQAIDSVPPTVRIHKPIKGAIVSEGETVLSAQAADNVRVTRVEYLLSGGCCTVDKLVGVADPTVLGWVFHWRTWHVKDGRWALVAKAFDAAGNASYSPKVTVAVENPKLSITTRRSLTRGEWTLNIGVVLMIGLLAVVVARPQRVGSAALGRAATEE